MNEQRLLIVDDEADFAQMVARVATDLGYTTKVTTNGYDFQAAYQELQPTLIVLDMVMPEMDGNELVVWLMEQGYSSRLIIITGYSPEYAQDAQLLAEFKGLRSVSTLSKPIRLAQLREALSKDLA